MAVFLQLLPQNRTLFEKKVVSLRVKKREI